jgi:hypothetical protein
MSNWIQFFNPGSLVGAASLLIRRDATLRRSAMQGFGEDHIARLAAISPPAKGHKDKPLKLKSKGNLIIIV